MSLPKRSADGGRVWPGLRLDRSARRPPTRPSGRRLRSVGRAPRADGSYADVAGRRVVTWSMLVGGVGRSPGPPSSAQSRPSRWPAAGHRGGTWAVLGGRSLRARGHDHLAPAGRRRPGRRPGSGSATWSAATRASSTPPSWPAPASNRSPRTPPTPWSRRCSGARCLACPVCWPTAPSTPWTPCSGTARPATSGSGGRPLGSTTSPNWLPARLTSAGFGRCVRPAASTGRRRSPTRRRPRRGRTSQPQRRRGRGGLRRRPRRAARRRQRLRAGDRAPGRPRRRTRRAGPRDIERAVRLCRLRHGSRRGAGRRPAVRRVRP